MNPIVLEEEAACSLQDEILSLRLEAEENQRDLDSRCYQRDFTRTYQPPEHTGEGFGSFFLRTALSLLIFCGFLWLQKENRSVLGMAPATLQEAISTTVVLQEALDSVTMENITETQNQ